MQGEDYTLGNVEDLDPSDWQVPSDAFPRIPNYHDMPSLQTALVHQVHLIHFPESI